tara:strand:- start:850 stop:1563 length:714 start_codon:yes stop_codon:yes gene_type:complete
MRNKMGSRTLAIMQPTYLSWIGYFDLIDQSDRFVFLDSVQFDKRSWQQRNRIKSTNGILWLTVPVLTKGRHNQQVCEVEIDQSQDFVEKHIKTIQFSYRKADFYEEYIVDLAGILRKRHRFLADLNIELIQWFCKCFDIQTEMVRSSSFESRGQKVELLVDLCRMLDGNRYLSPTGSKAYINENNLFGPQGIELVYHAYHHPRYRQLHGEFTPHLSALDLLLNKGPDCLSVIQNGRS